MNDSRKELEDFINGLNAQAAAEDAEEKKSVDDETQQESTELEDNLENDFSDNAQDKNDEIVDSEDVISEKSGFDWNREFEKDKSLGINSTKEEQNFIDEDLENNLENNFEDDIEENSADNQEDTSEDIFSENTNKTLFDRNSQEEDNIFVEENSEENNSRDDEYSEPAENVSFSQQTIPEAPELTQNPHENIPEMNFSASLQEPTSATYTEKAPLKDFLAIILILPVLPLYLLYLIVKGKNKKFTTYFFAGLLLFSAVSFLGYKQYQIFKAKHKKAITNIDEYLGEPEINQKEFEKEYKSQVSTLASSIDAKKLPKELEPMFFIPQDMLTINYYHYLISAGYMGQKAEGAIYILQTALYSKNQNLSKAALESLKLIGTPQALQVVELFQKTPQRKQNSDKKTERFENNEFGNTIKNEYDKFKYNLQNVGQ